MSDAVVVHENRLAAQGGTEVFDVPVDRRPGVGHGEVGERTGSFDQVGGHVVNGGIGVQKVGHDNTFRESGTTLQSIPQGGRESRVGRDRVVEAGDLVGA